MTTPLDLPKPADPYPALYIGNDDDLKAVAHFANVLRLQGNIHDGANPRGYLGWWNAATKWNDLKAMMGFTSETLHQVQGHPMARELSRLILAAAEYAERQIGDGSEAVRKAVDALKDLGFEVTLHRATEQRLAATK